MFKTFQCQFVIKTDLRDRTHNINYKIKCYEIMIEKFFPLTLPKDFKSLFCGFYFNFCAASHIHVVILIFTEDLGLRRPGTS